MGGKDGSRADDRHASGVWGAGLLVVQAAIARPGAAPRAPGAPATAKTKESCQEEENEEHHFRSSATDKAIKRGESAKKALRPLYRRGRSISSIALLPLR